MLVAEVRDLGVIACAKPLLHSYVPTPTRPCARNCSTWVEADSCTLRAVHLIFHTPPDPVTCGHWGMLRKDP